MKNILLIVGVLCLVGAGVWRFAIAPQYEQRFPDGWEWVVNSIGQTSFADETTGQFPEGTTLADDPINLTIRTVTADASAAPDGQALISDHYETRNATTNAVDWEFTTTATVDQQTGKHVGDDLEGDYYFLPRHVDKNTTYYVSNSTYQHIPMVFQTEEEVAGLNTYKYAYQDDMNNTVAYDYITLEQGQTIICFGFELDYWVEPVTGETIKFREWCEGDWVVDQATGERLYAISRWGGETSGDDLIRRVDIVRGMLNTYNMNTLYIPGALALLGIILLIIGFVPGLRGSQAEQKVTA